MLAEVRKWHAVFPSQVITVGDLRDFLYNRREWHRLALPRAVKTEVEKVLDFNGVEEGSRTLSFQFYVSNGMALQRSCLITFGKVQQEAMEHPPPSKTGGDQPFRLMSCLCLREKRRIRLLIPRSLKGQLFQSSTVWQRRLVLIQPTMR